MTDQKLRVLVVDDSAYVRKVVSQMLSSEANIEVVGTARDGTEALEMVDRLQPDVVTTDLIMPGMDGVGFITEQMRRRPLPIVVISIANEAGERVLAALDAGAIDFIQKPTALATEKLLDMSRELAEKVTAAAGASLAALPPPIARPAVVPATRGARHVDIVVLGISTGGPHALRYLAPQLPADFPVPIAIVMHMPFGYTEMYAKKLDELTPLTVVEAHEGTPVRAGTIVIAQAGRHLSFERRADGEVVCHLDIRPLDMLHRPAVDVTFQSAAEIYGARVLGVIMTGMGMDGRDGCAWIKAKGGTIITESEESCVVFGMPRSVIESGLSDATVPLDRMATAILERL
jgi:two-component system, chemotaxis family, protein-glutamate methylesterase/glutaminase